MIYLDKVKVYLVELDMWVSKVIEKLLESYIPYQEPPFLASLIPIAIKALLYEFVLLVPFVLLKLLYPYQKIFNIFVISILILIGISLAFVFLGFFQLMYYF